MSAAKRLFVAVNAAALVGLPTFALAVTFDRPGWMWLAVWLFGTAALYRVLRHMEAVIALDRELNPEVYEVEPAPPLREQVDGAVLTFLRDTGLLLLMERLAGWLAKRLKRDEP